MIGRGIFGTPWLFSELKGKKITPTTEKKLKILIEHSKLFEKKLKGYKNFSVMKKHFKAYVNEFPGAKELREKLMQTEDSKETESVIKGFLKTIDTN